MMCNVVRGILQVASHGPWNYFEIVQKGPLNIFRPPAEDAAAKYTESVRFNQATFTHFPHSAISWKNVLSCPKVYLNTLV